MNINEIERYWLVSSEDDMETSIVLFKNKKYSQSMFSLHLAVEKIAVKLLLASLVK